MKENYIEGNIYDLFKASDYKEVLGLSRDKGDFMPELMFIGNFYINGDGAKLKNSKEVIEVLNEIVKTYIIFEPDYDEMTYQMDDKKVPLNNGKYVASVNYKILPKIVLDKISELADKVKKKKEVLEEKKKQENGEKNSYYIYEKLNNLEI